MISIRIVLTLISLFQSHIIIDATGGGEEDVSLSEDTQAKLDAINDVQELKKLAINATKEKKKVERAKNTIECELKNKLNYAMFECALSIMKIDLEDAYYGQGVQKLSLKEDERKVDMPQDGMNLTETFGLKMADDIETCFLKWNAFIERQKSFVFVQLILKKLAEHHKRELTRADIADFIFHTARNIVFLRQKWRDFLDAMKRAHAESLKKNERRTFVDLLDPDMLKRWHIRTDDIAYLNIVRDALLRKDHLLTWSCNKEDKNVVLPQAPIQMCPALI